MIQIRPKTGAMDTACSVSLQRFVELTLRDDTQGICFAVGDTPAATVALPAKERFYLRLLAQSFPGMRAVVRAARSLYLFTETADCYADLANCLGQQLTPLDGKRWYSLPHDVQASYQTAPTDDRLLYGPPNSKTLGRAFDLLGYRVRRREHQVELKHRSWNLETESLWYQRHPGADASGWVEFDYFLQCELRDQIYQQFQDRSQEPYWFDDEHWRVALGSLVALAWRQYE